MKCLYYLLAPLGDPLDHPTKPAVAQRVGKPGHVITVRLGSIVAGSSVGKWIYRESSVGKWIYRESSVGKWIYRESSVGHWIYRESSVGK